MSPWATDVAGRQQEASVLVVDEEEPGAVGVREHLPHAQRVLIAAQRLMVLQQHTHHSARLGDTQRETQGETVRDTVRDTGRDTGRDS